MSHVSDSFGRAVRRLVAGGDVTQHDGGRVEVGNRDAAHMFAGTDLPGREVLDQLSEFIDDHVAGRDALDTRDLKGIALAAFLFGWESRS